MNATERALWAGFYGVPAAKRGNKYHAKRTERDGIVFDSAKEARFYDDLKLREAAGEIAELQLQPVFWLHVIRAAYSGPMVTTTIGRFTADFQYLDLKTGEYVVVDVKSQITRKGEAYRLRKRLVEAIHGIVVTEI